MNSRSFPALVAVFALVPACLGRAVSTNGTQHTIRPRALAQVYSNCNTPNTVALTFDDGPAGFHKDISSRLANAGIQATFFVNGDNFDCIYDPVQVSSLKASFGAGHQIASHTWSHPDLTTLSGGQLSSQFTRINTALQKILGVVPAVMRPPYGSYNDAVRQAASNVGQSIILWSFDSEDSVGATPQASKQAYTALANQRPSDIISLQHETIETTANDVLPFAIQTLKNAGYNFATVSDCLGIPAYRSQGSPGTRDSSWTC